MENKNVRVMFITPMDPFFVGGGSISAERFLISLDSLRNEGKIADYIVIYLDKGGKQPVKRDFRAYPFRKTFFTGVISRLLLKASSLEVYTKEILRLVEQFRPDIILVHFSTLGNLVERIKKKNKDLVIVQNFDNFEVELREVGINKNPVLRLFEKQIAKKSEKKALFYADVVTSLRRSEWEKIRSYYKIDKECFVIPFTLGKAENNQECKKTSLKDKLNILFTGSLDFLPNIEAVDFLFKSEGQLEKISRDHGIKDIQITIAGSNPKKEVVEFVKNSNHVTLVSNPSKEEMKQIFQNSHLYISPVFSGPGMKTKVIEALYNGLPIIASETSLNGYLEDTTRVFNKFIFPFKDREYGSFFESFERALCFVKDKDLCVLQQEIIDFYNKTYSPERITRLVEAALLHALGTRKYA